MQKGTQVNILALADVSFRLSDAKRILSFILGLATNSWSSTKKIMQTTLPGEAE